MTGQFSFNRSSVPNHEYEELTKSEGLTRPPRMVVIVPLQSYPTPGALTHAREP